MPVGIKHLEVSQDSQQPKTYTWKLEIVTGGSDDSRPLSTPRAMATAVGLCLLTWNPSGAGEPAPLLDLMAKTTGLDEGRFREVLALIGCVDDKDR
jgi:hypothetical protein